MTDRLVLQDKPCLAEIFVFWPALATPILCTLACPLLVVSQIELLASCLSAIVLAFLALLDIRIVFDVIAREYTVYRLYDHSLVKESGILTHRQTTVPLDKIQAVCVEQGAMARALDYGTLFLYSNGKCIERISRVRHPRQWQSAVLERMDHKGMAS